MTFRSGDIQVHQSTIHTIEIVLGDEIVEQLRDAGWEDIIQIQLRSAANNRQPAPIKLSHSTVIRLTQDAS